jgi:hypothetical protein
MSLTTDQKLEELERANAELRRGRISKDSRRLAFHQLVSDRRRRWSGGLRLADLRGPLPGASGPSSDTRRGLTRVLRIGPATSQAAQRPLVRLRGRALAVVEARADEFWPCSSEAAHRGGSLPSSVLGRAASPGTRSPGRGHPTARRKTATRALLPLR